MSSSERGIEGYRDHLMEVPRDWLLRRLEMFRLSKDVMDVPPIVCLDEEISNKYAKWRDWIHPLDPISLDDLKNWFGVSNDVALRQQVESVPAPPDATTLGGKYSRVEPQRLPKRSFNFEGLDEVERADVLQTANKLLFGYVDPEEAKRPEILAVIEYMLERARRSGVTILVAPNLIVCPDHEVILSNLPAMMFSNILIYGNGQITTKSHTSIHAYQIQHINA
jgi:hypothetical protein